MKQKRLFTCCAALFTLCLMSISCTSKSSERPLAKFEPADGHCYLFVGQEAEAIGGYDSLTGYIDHFQAPYGITIYTNFRKDDTSYDHTYTGLDGLTSAANWGAGICYADKQLMAPALDGCAIAIGLELVNHEQDVAAGLCDSNILGLGEWISKYNDRQVFLRIGYEFDGHAWNHYEAKAYVAAFRRIVDKLREMHVDNVAFVWQCIGAGSTSEDLVNYFPGDDYVDWCGYSHFRDGTSPAMLDFARQHKKPVFIAEATPMFRQQEGKAVSLHLNNSDEASRAWDEWFAPLFQLIDDNPDLIKALSYINCHWEVQPMWQDGGIFSQIDARLQTSESVSKRWNQYMGNGLFVLGASKK